MCAVLRGDIAPTTNVRKDREFIMNTLKTLQTLLEKLSLAGKVANFILETALCRDEDGQPCERDMRAGITTKMPSVFPTLFANEVNALGELIPKREAWALGTLRTMAGHSIVNERMATDVRAAARYASTLVENERQRLERENAREEQKRDTEEAQLTLRLTEAIRVLGVQDVWGTPSVHTLEKLLAQHRATALAWVARAVERVNALSLMVGEPIEEARVDESANAVAIRARLNELFKLENSLQARKIAQNEARREHSRAHARFQRSQRELAEQHDRARGKTNGRRREPERHVDTKFDAKLRELKARARTHVAAAE